MSELFEIEEVQIKKWLVNRKIVTTRESYTKPMNQVGYYCFTALILYCFTALLLYTKPMNQVGYYYSNCSVLR